MKKIYLTVLISTFLTMTALAKDQPGLAVGVQAPDFEAVNYKGEEVRLSNYYQDGPVVLIFYRGGWCMYCNLQLQAFQKELDEFKNLGVPIVALSVDRVQKAAETVAGKELGFEVVTNPEADILEAYGLIYKVPDELAKKYKEEYNIDLEAASGQTHHIIAIPATYVVDQNGIIIFAYANVDYKVRPEVEEILEFLKTQPIH